MLNIYGDLQRQILVSGQQNPRAFVPFPALYAAQSLPLTLWALQPTGDPVTPYALPPLTAALVSLSTVNAGVDTLVASSAAWTVAGAQLTGSFAIPGVSFPAGQQYLPAVLAIDFTTADGITHIETSCVLRNPAFPVTVPAPGVGVEPDLGAPTSDGSLLMSTVAKVRSWLATTAWGRAALGYADADAFYTANPPPGGGADTPAARDEAIAAALAALPTPIQPPSAYDANDYKFAQAGLAGDPYSGNFVTSVLDISNQGITSIDPSYLTSAINFSRYVAAGVTGINASGNAFTQAGVNSFLDTLGAYAQNFGYAFTVDVSGGTSAAPTPQTPHMDAAVVYTFSGGVSPGKSVEVYNQSLTGSPNKPLDSIILRTDLPLDSSFSDDANITIGTSDAPTGAQIAASVVALFQSGGFDVPDAIIDNGDGSITITETQDQYLPLLGGSTGDPDLVFSGTTGQPYVPRASILAIRQAGGLPTYNT